MESIIDIVGMHLVLARVIDASRGQITAASPREADRGRNGGASLPAREFCGQGSNPPAVPTPDMSTSPPASSPPRLRQLTFVADTTALIVFFTATGVINERCLAGMTWDQVFHARLLGAALMVPVGRPYGVWRDWIMRHARPSLMSQLLWDSLALVTFQVPIYAAIIAVSGASGRGLLWGVLGAAGMMLALGRPYGAFLNWVRALFGLPPGGLRPMSLNTPP